MAICRSACRSIKVVSAERALGRRRDGFIISSHAGVFSVFFSSGRERRHGPHADEYTSPSDDSAGSACPRVLPSSPCIFMFNSSPGRGPASASWESNRVPGDLRRLRAAVQPSSSTAHCNRPAEGSRDADVAHGENESDTPSLVGALLESRVVFAVPPGEKGGAGPLQSN
ncbi:hypothetical protein EYF80_037131 [Liparis tanakae]|uniref:Uncharacterized protein n=1 Tax=Liparis tanakae TaxID=230148 RepID=A0A4Z2GH90_9TELE|nr:hypothetical protein EYF80_037131 [Liparis tanakae]